MPRKTVLLASLSLASVLFVAPSEAGHCGTPLESVHTYGLAGSASATTAQTGTVGAGATIVFDNNTFDCDGNGLPDDFDGDYESGIGGGYFGIAGNDQVNADCGLGLHLHTGTTVTVADALSSTVSFSAGYEGLDADEVYCDPNGTDGIVGDDPADCIVDAVDSVAVDPCAGSLAVGANMDAGVWLFLSAAVTDAPTASGATSGTITCGDGSGPGPCEPHVERRCTGGQCVECKVYPCLLRVPECTFDDP